MPTSKNNRKNNKHKKKRHPDPNKRSALSNSLFEKAKEQSVVHKIGEKTPHKDNLPELIMAFIKDELEARTAQDEQREIINAGIACWNIGAFGEKEDMEQKLMLTVTHVKADEKLGQTMRKLLERRVSDYSEYKYFIVDYEINRTVVGTWDLSVSSFDLTALAAMKEAAKN